jgi:hypothetical protein
MIGTKQPANMNRTFTGARRYRGDSIPKCVASPFAFSDRAVLRYFVSFKPQS